MANDAAAALARFQRQMERIRKESAGAVRGALGRAADLVTAEQRRLVPVKTGKTRASIGWTFGDAPKYATLKAVRRSGADVSVAIFAGNAKLRTAHLTEFGTKPHSVAKGARRKSGRLQHKGPHHPGARPSPFFYPGYRATRSAARRLIGKAIRDAVKRAVDA